jgi:FkbM family methyltransferase
MDKIFMIDRYEVNESIFSRYKNKIKQAIFERITRNSLPYFTRGGDAISVSSQIYGFHELPIRRLFEEAARSGYSDFLVDIGANIGLSSCQTGNLFSEVHCFEPNPNCFRILSVNAQTAVDANRLNLYNIGLGSQRATGRLLVPKHNWGGGFVLDEHNAYTMDLLAKKDGFENFATENYHDLEIEIHPAVEVFDRLFANLAKKKLVRGVVKIDVEGYELTVLSALAQTLPPEKEILVVFENFDKRLDEKSLLAQFGRRAQLFQVLRTPIKKMNRIRRVVEILMELGYRYKLVPFDKNTPSNDLVMIIGRNGEC